MDAVERICQEARKVRLNQGLLMLAEWAKSRVDSEHNYVTTMTMLIRKVNELEDAVNRAGWAAIKGMKDA